MIPYLSDHWTHHYAGRGKPSGLPSMCGCNGWITNSYIGYYIASLTNQIEKGYEEGYSYGPYRLYSMWTGLKRTHRINYL